MTCQNNSDYSASKFAMNGFYEALRYELENENSPVKLTNFYPYYINTGLFSGFVPSSILTFILPILNVKDVADRMHQAILAEEKEVYIYSCIYWMKIVM